MALSEENGFDGIEGLAALYGVSARQLVQLDCGVWWDVILNGKPIEVRSAVGQAARCSIYCRVCGQCFATDRKPYHRSEWDQPLSLVCRIHSTLLLDACESCGRPIDYLRRSVTRCSCGARFPNAGKAVPEWVHGMVRFFVDIEDPSRRAGFALPSTDETNAARALVRIADHQAGRRTLYASGTRVVVPMVRQTHLEDLRPWFEEGAASFLARMRELGGEKEGWMRYRISLKLYKFPALSAVLSGAIKGKPLRVRRAERNGEGAPEVFYRANDLRLAFHMNPEALDYWVSVGILPADAFPPGQRSRISSAAFEKVKKLFEDSCLQQEASERLGCTRQVVRRLIRLGALKRAHLLPSVANDRVELESLHDLCRLFLSRIAPGPIQGQSISFEEVVKTIETTEVWKAMQSHIESEGSVQLQGGGGS
ncbi:TniQ family protein [Variovorax sp. J31P207]|uniref:TniQ family protein n=1 Tax=Variovorax sp. J31P207 TaxID=3053510 RepID=UPI0025786C30|nr:TniQ family protein [Variovorax sp. J31P207]MDM0065376.1 TniQ family protein [Variovorax sp. J31P207]